MAATCSEIFNGDYHYVQSEETAHLYGHGAELLIRDMFVADMSRFGEKFTADMREQLLDNEALYGLAADITAAKYFPTSEEVQKFLRIYIKQLSSGH